MAKKPRKKFHLSTAARKRIAAKDKAAISKKLKGRHFKVRHWAKTKAKTKAKAAKKATAAHAPRAHLGGRHAVGTHFGPRYQASRGTQLGPVDQRHASKRGTHFGPRHKGG